MPIYRTLNFSPFYLINKTFHHGKKLTGSIVEGKSNIQQLTSGLSNSKYQEQEQDEVTKTVLFNLCSLKKVVFKMEEQQF